MTVQSFAVIRDEPVPIEIPPDVAPVRKFARTSTNDLMATKFEPLKVIVDGYLYEGFTVLAGRQKLGKTWLAIDWAVSVAAGGCAMGSIPCDAGDVLYVDLENGQRRVQSRIAALFPDERTRPDLNRLLWMHSAPGLNAGLIGELEAWRQSAADPKLVVVVKHISIPVLIERGAVGDGDVADGSDAAALRVVRRDRDGAARTRDRRVGRQLRTSPCRRGGWPRETHLERCRRYLDGSEAVHLDELNNVLEYVAAR